MQNNRDNVNLSYKDGFRVMQLTDIHLVRADGFGPEQRTLDVIRDLVEMEKPDFIAITGDLSYSDWTDCCYRVFCDFMDEIGIPWAYAMGNHDDELGPGYEALEQILYWSKTCLYRHGAADTEGHGNYTVSLVEGVRNPVWVLYFMDTHKEGYLADAQVDWYKGRRDDICAAEGKTVPAMTFMHIPFKEYKDVWASGVPGLMLESVACLGTDNGMINAMQEKGDMKGVFVGHDPVNDFAGDYNGILLAYGRGTCTGHEYIGGIHRGGYMFPGMLPGCRMIILNRDASFETYVRLCDGTVLYKD